MGTPHSGNNYAIIELPIFDGQCRVVIHFPAFREGCGSEQIPEGASICQKPPIDNVERFLSMLRFDSGENARFSHSVEPEMGKNWC
jgi:hypothetical protein